MPIIAKGTQEPDLCKGKGGLRRFCSFCGEPFEVFPYRALTARFCSHSCAGLIKKGPTAGGWRGGDTTHSQGYLASYDPLHPNVQAGHGIYVYEHRRVAASMLERPLTRDEVVHHVNGNKRDNRPENLLVMTQSEHAKLHHKKRTQHEHQ